MIRFLGGALLAGTLLFGAIATEYEDQLKSYLTSSSLPIAGKFYLYDFNHDGQYAMNDWLYVVAGASDQEYRLLGKTPTPNDPFGWQKVDVTPPDQEPNGYFVYLPNCSCDVQNMGTNAFSWIYITQGKVYKLMGANPDHSFRYYDRDEDGMPDPLEGISYTISDDKVTFTSQTALPKRLLYNAPKISDNKLQEDLSTWIEYEEIKKEGK